MGEKRNLGRSHLDEEKKDGEEKLSRFFIVRKKNIAVLSLYVMLSQYVYAWKNANERRGWVRERRKRVNNIKVFFFLASCTIFSMKACGVWVKNYITSSWRGWLNGKRKWKRIDRVKVYAYIHWRGIAIESSLVDFLCNIWVDLRLNFRAKKFSLKVFHLNFKDFLLLFFFFFIQ